MTLNLDIPDVPDSHGPAPPPYTPYATESESTVVSNVHHSNACHRSVRNANGSAHAHAHPSSANTTPSPSQRLTLHNPSSPTPSENAEAGPSRPRQSSVSKPRPRAAFPSEQQSSPVAPAPQVPHTPPRPEDLRDRGRSNSAWRQYLQGLPVSNGPDIGNLSLDDKANKPLPPTPPPLPSRSPRPPPPVPPPASRLDPRSRQPPPPPLQSTPPRQATGPVSAPVSFPAARPAQPPQGSPHEYAVHHTWHNHPQSQARPQRHSAPVVQPPVQYVHEVPQTVQRVYEVPAVQRVHEVPVQRAHQAVNQQQQQPVRQVHHSPSTPQFAHPDSRHLVRPLDPRRSEPGLPRRRQNSTPSAGPSGMAFQQIGLPPSIPERRTSLPDQPPPAPPKPGAASEFPPPILRTAPKPTEPANFPPPPRHIVARGGTPQRSPQRGEARTPRRAPSVIDLTQDTSPSSAGSPPKAARPPRAQSDVGRPSPRDRPAAASVVSAPSASRNGGSVLPAPRSAVSAASSTPKRKPSSAVSSPAASPASPSKVRCSGYTRAGERCKRLVRDGAPGAADERYCKDHAGLLLKAAGFYARRAPGAQGAWVEFKTYIPRVLGAQTQALLRTTMESPLSVSETPGFLYVYELRGMGAPATSFFKVGRSDCVPRRLGQWASQCSSHAPVLRDVFPLADTQGGGSTLPGAMRAEGQMAAASKRWERLVHLELADRAAAERPLACRALEGKCADCGAVHREIFPLASSEGYAVVVEAITRWERFVRAIA